MAKAKRPSKPRERKVKGCGSQRERGESGEWQIIGMTGSEICCREKWKMNLEGQQGPDYHEGRALSSGIERS